MSHWRGILASSAFVVALLNYAVACLLNLTRSWNTERDISETNILVTSCFWLLIAIYLRVTPAASLPRETPR